jgi:hypothetical protein
MREPPTTVDPVDPMRVRTPPAHFAWIDHRLRERLRELTLKEIAVLVFLHLADDRTGCSFWADEGSPGSHDPGLDSHDVQTLAQNATGHGWNLEVKAYTAGSIILIDKPSIPGGDEPHSTLAQLARCLLSLLDVSRRTVVEF